VSSSNLGRLSLQVVGGVRIITVFEMEELEEIIGELMKITQKVSDYFGKVYDCFIYSCNLYLVMEYFENGSLMDAVIT
jgi:serine/threonine protein kinase